MATSKPTRMKKSSILVWRATNDPPKWHTLGTTGVPILPCPTNYKKR